MTSWKLLLFAFLCVDTSSAVPSLGAQHEARAGSQLNPDVFYTISNNAPGHEGTRQSFRGEWFEVYSAPIHIRHANVFWRVMDPVPLPNHIVSRYAREGSAAMAVTGWEVDVVRKTSNGSDESVPCYRLYNHHHTVYLMGEHLHLHMLEHNGVHGQFKFGADVDLARHQRHGGAPLVQGFNQNNGNEHRQTFHGLPPKAVQPIVRPTRLLIHPMMISTANPADPTKPGGPLPKSARSREDSTGTTFNGLAECPCTTRISRVPPNGNSSTGVLDGRVFINDCRPPPLSTLAEEHNPTCAVETYTAGLLCCQDGTVLLDSDQNNTDFEDEVFYKLRFYFKDYAPKTDLPAFHMEWSLTGGVAGEIPGNPRAAKRIEYDVLAAPAGVTPEKVVHDITSVWTLRDMLHPCDSATNPYCADPRLAERGLFMMMAGAHCHAPACMEAELRNVDTGEVLCHIKARHGASKRAKDESGYIWMPPCQWGWQERSLREPPLLPLNTKLTSTIRYNATGAHPGVMALWQIRAAYPEAAGVLRFHSSGQAIPRSENPVPLLVRIAAAPALLVAGAGLTWTATRYRRRRASNYAEL